MGNVCSRDREADLSNLCTNFAADASSAKASWGDSIQVSMRNWKEDDDRTELWGVTYETGKKLEHRCSFELKTTHDDNEVKSINLGLSDSADNEAKIFWEITMVGRDGLRGELTSYVIAPPGCRRSFTSAQQDYSIETTIISYNCSYRDGLFILEMKKMKHCDNASMATMKHYYVTKDVGFYLEANICRSKYGKGLEVVVKRPLKWPSAQLRGLIEDNRRSAGILLPGPGVSLASEDTSQIVNNASASNHGTANSSNNHDNQNPNCFPAKIYQFNICSSGDRENNFGDCQIYNCGTFHGHGNGCFIDADEFDASTMNSYNK